MFDDSTVPDQQKIIYEERYGRIKTVDRLLYKSAIKLAFMVKKIFYILCHLKIKKKVLRKKIVKEFYLKNTSHNIT